MADVTVETAIVEMERKINFLMKVVEEQDHEIGKIKCKFVKLLESIKLILSNLGTKERMWCKKINHNNFYGFPSQSNNYSI